MDDDFALLNNKENDVKDATVKNAVTDVFSWTLQNTLSCTECSYSSITEDTCRDIAIDFPVVDKENKE